MGTTSLHQLLRSLCYNTHWNYAIFWKLKHRARMILTWEDGYYENSDYYDSSENKYCQKTLEPITDGKFSHDTLGSAMAKMSYLAYSLGEGIVGQVAVTGEHRWICADNQVTGSGLSFEFADGWRSQFSAGIKTIVVVAVIPLGVVQLGSLTKVTEDMGVVNHIKNLFLSTQDYSIDHIPKQIQNSLKSSSSQLDILMENLSSDKTMSSAPVDVLMPLQCSRRNYAPHFSCGEVPNDMAKHEGPELYNHTNSILLQSMSNMINVEQQNFEETRPLNDSMHTSEKVTVDSTCFPIVFPDAAVCESDKLNYVHTNQKGMLKFARPSDANSHNHTKKYEFHPELCDKGTSYLQTEPCYEDNSHTLLKFPAGCELHEALGPAFLKGSNYFDFPAQANQRIKTVNMPDEISTTYMTSESPPEHLLEAMVANISHCNNDVNSGLSSHTSMQSAITSGKNPEASIHNVHTINSDGYSVDHTSHVREEKHHCLSSSSGICDMMSSKGASSTCLSSYSEQFERSSEPSKNSKKRARPGESCRPRPRDRQLIQDRIKELRELVPNGAKCSIDSLLERTIKHMVFLQSITKHADKLTNFADSKSKLNHKETDILGYEQGSSWAVEVGGHLKVHSILVENLSKNGQMLVEMLCEECCHFLEIAEAIRSLGLIILKGATKARDEKIWICFIVEDQNNRNVHRLDILWPLVQILQSKSTVFSQ